MSQYRVALESLSSFIDKLAAFDNSAEAVTSTVDQLVSRLHETWAGSAADAHQSRHDEWMQAASNMREAVGKLRQAAHDAHHNYNRAVSANTTMWQ